MKYIDKKIEEPRTGASASYHVVSGLQTEYTSGNTFVTISSYVSKDKKDEGKESLSINTFTIPGVPGWDVIPYEWALSELVKAQPEDVVPEARLKTQISKNKTAGNSAVILFCCIS